ncbi:(2Fe-2S)-binding protein [Porphyrobacter algicida]|uniref:(2Fe-2S)-binding protein n=1 Tax=Qipengyuania algicida TaxID=1836209 RepID=A0A845AQU8_9SPHN|nr:(2Fe-2S)-binding protein [Qipengyuania algicida]
MTIEVDGQMIDSFSGETLLAALVAAGHMRLRNDQEGQPRGFWCNMGTCSECFVSRLDVTPVRRIRACLITVEDGMRIATRSISYD